MSILQIRKLRSRDLPQFAKLHESQASPKFTSLPQLLTAHIVNYFLVWPGTSSVASCTRAALMTVSLKAHPKIVLGK